MTNYKGDRSGGMSALCKDLPRLTDGFFRAAGSNVERSSLGLWRVDRIARQYGGEGAFAAGLVGWGPGLMVRFARRGL